MAAFDDNAYRVNSLANLLAVNNDGDDLAAADEKYRQLMAELTAHIGDHKGEAKGTLKVEFIFTADSKGVDVAIVPTISARPKRPKTKMRYFVTDKGDGLTLKNPNKGGLFEGVDTGRRARGEG